MKKIFKRIIALVAAMVIPMQSFVAYAAVDNIKGWSPALINATGDVTIDTEVYHNGSGSMKVVNYTPGTGNKYISISTNLSLVKGRKYYVGAWIKSIDTSSAFFHVSWGARYSVLNYGSTFDWRNYEYIHTEEVGGTRAFFMTVEGTTAGFWMDDMRFIDSVTGENLLSNATFDVAGADNKVENEDSDIDGDNLEDIYNEIKSGTAFSEENMQKVSGAFMYMPVYTAEGIKVDGKGTDWAGYPAFSMPTMKSQYLELESSTKPKDNTATAKFAYDDKNFYIYLEVTDDVHTYFAGNDNYWRGDSVQLTISTLDESYGSEVGFAHNPTANKGEVYGIGFLEEDMKEISVSTSNEDNKTIYEVAVPWHLKYETLPSELLFSVIVNDNDGEGRKYVLELAPGIATDKVNSQFPRLELMSGKKDWYGWVEAERKGTVNVEHVYSCYIVNSGDAKKFTVKDKETGEVTEYNIPAHSGVRHEIKRTYEKEGDFSVSVEISNGTETFESTAKVKIELPPVDEDYANDVIKTMRKQVSEIAELIKKCEDKGLSTDYERANHTIMNIFPDSLVADMAQGDLSRVYYTERTVTELYNETKEALSAYLAGEKTPRKLSKYVTSDMTLKNQGATASMEYDGIVEEKPIIYVGYGHFERAAADIGLFEKMGMNYIQNEVGPNQTMVNVGGASDGSEYVFDNNSGGAKKIINLLNNAEKSNVSVCLLISPHYFPDGAMDKYGIGGGSGFIKYNINAPQAKTLIENYVRGIVSLVKDYPALNSICLSNEPAFHPQMFPAFYTSDWQLFLKNRYGSIEDLNTAYGESFTSFEDIKMIVEDVPAIKLYDMKLYKDKVLSEWHKWLSDIVKEIAPDIPLHAKVISYVHPDYKWIQDEGVGYENYHQFLEINGCDAHRFHGIHDPLIKSLWYDYMTSLKDAPVANTEDHLIPDGDQSFSADKAYEVKKWVAEDIYQGAIHGRGQTAIWVWARDYNKSGALYGSALERPDALATMSEAALDLNRLAYEITALQNEQRDVGIIYPDASMYLEKVSMNASYDVYDALISNGVRPLFVVDSQAEKMHNMKMLIIPQTKYIPENTLLELKKYIDNGGKVVILGKDMLKKNEKNLDNDPALVNYIYQNSQVVDYVAGNETLASNMKDGVLAGVIREALKNAGAYYVQVVDAATNEPIYGVEANIGVYDEKIILNLDSYNADTKVKVLFGGKVVDKFYDLRADEAVNSDTIELEKYIPRTFSIEWDNTFIDTFGHWSEENIKSLAKTGIVSGISESRYAPNAGLTRAEFLALLTRACNFGKAAYTGNVADVDKDAWYAQNVAVAIENGIISAGETFRPDDKITREEMCDLLIKCYEAKNGQIENYTKADFVDLEAVSDNISKAVALNLMYGHDDGSFAPLSGATRAEAAAVISRFIG